MSNSYKKTNYEKQLKQLSEKKTILLNVFIIKQLKTNVVEFNIYITNLGDKTIKNHEDVE